MDVLVLKAKRSCAKYMVSCIYVHRAACRLIAELGEHSYAQCLILTHMLQVNCVRFMWIHHVGMKNINAYNLSSVGSIKGTALYPTYALINSHCNSNTR